MLIGREPEQRFVESLFADVREGRSAVLVVRGEAGIGKSALLAAAAEAGGRVLRCTGVESEHDLPFAALQQLLRPLAGLVDGLPPPQASAMRSAFGLSAEQVEDRLLLGLATLNLLAEAGEGEPLVCVVDDLQWVDAPSAQALLFAARRLDAEGILMLFAVRDDPSDWFEVPDLPQLTLGSLTEEAARQVVAARPSLSAQSVDRLLREAAGNPLALLELPLDGEVGAGSGGVEAAFRARVAQLAPDARRLLLVAASTDGDEPRAWDELSELAGVPLSARDPAVKGGLVGDTATVLFRHPLVRSAIQSATTRAEHSEAHRLLAAASDDPLGRASHLATATDGVDERVAAELEAAADGELRRGAFGSVADAFARAAELSEEPESRVRRLARAAQAALDAGRPEQASALAAEALPRAAAATDQAALAHVRGMLELQRGSPERAYTLLSEAARATAPSDAALALALAGGAIASAFIAGWPERAFAETHALVQTLPANDTREDRFLRAFLGGMAASAAGSRDEAKPLLEEAVRIGKEIDDLRFIVWVGMASVYLGDVPSATDHYVRAAATARAVGSFSVLPTALMALGRLSVTLWDIPVAEECVREGAELVRQLGQENLGLAFSAILARLLAFRGEADECRELAGETLKRALAHGVVVAVTDLRLALAELALSLGNGAEAREQLEQIPHELIRLAATPTLVEAALLTGDPGSTAEDVERLAAYAEQARNPYFLGLVARCRAQLAQDPAAAENLYTEALAHQTQHTPAFERARTELAFGELLRRVQRRTDARVQLRNALATFEGLGARLWADRARGELEATGMTARKRDPSTLDTLTPQELRIARLVGAGASNRDVAAQLFLSPKTVEYHLRKVFQKLGVSSRVELARLPFDAQPA